MRLRRISLPGGGDTQEVQIVPLGEDDECGGVVGDGDVEVCGEVAPVRADEALRLVFAGRGSDADGARAGSKLVHLVPQTRPVQQ